jgi:hypothetical protein
MAEPIIADINVALQQLQFPTITLWNRLEGRPRTHNFERTLQAPVHDPLWFWTRQWQMGEFKCNDTGSPVFAKLDTTTSPLDGYQPADQPPEDFDDAIPLETRVERRPIPFAREGRDVGLDLRLLMGRHWLKLLSSVGDFRDDFLTLYGISVPDPTSADDADICADRDAWQHVAAVAGHAMDGHSLYRHIKNGGVAHDGTSIPAALRAEVDALGERFVAWFERLYQQPPGEDAWRPKYLEYQFSVSAPDETGNSVLIADEYPGGELDWYALDIDPARNDLGDVTGPLPDPLTQSFIPVPLTFEGVPNTRWWTFEDSRTNLGDLNPGTKDLSKLMLAEFALVFANDWFLFPLTLTVGTATRINGLAITDVFGERTWVEAAGRGRDEDWQRWTMYTAAVAGTADVQADTRSLLLPTVPKVQTGEPVEDVMLIRDEMANMVWGIETRVPLPHGRSASGYEAAVDLRHFYERLVADSPGPEPAPAAAALRYTVMSRNVPENWIPFIPVHVPGDNRQIQLQRAALPRIIPQDPNPPVKIRPRTALLGEGRGDDAPYLLHEEEVPRAGARVRQSFQRTRWYGGKVVTWLGAEKQTGRGGGRSNLRFDFLEPAGEAS